MEVQERFRLCALNLRLSLTLASVVNSAAKFACELSGGNGYDNTAPFGTHRPDDLELAPAWQDDRHWDEVSWNSKGTVKCLSDTPAITCNVLPSVVGSVMAQSW